MLNSAAQADLELAISAARATAAAITPFFGRDTPVDYKAPDQPVTEADLLADRLLFERLIGKRPAYGWLSEETADSPSRLACERVWIVDPIDGTRSFVQGYAEYAISIGLAVRGRAELGILMNPATGELYHAVRGGGAYLDGKPIRVAATGKSLPVLLASRADLRKGVFASLLERWRLQPLGSTAYKMAKVADGTADAYLSGGPKSEWDVCAAALIVAEAGGKVTDLSGAELRFNQPAPFLRGMVCARPQLHERLLREAAALFSSEHGPTGETR
jgi:myo-inositol-1(or 4)-monophosphatase